MSLGEPPTRKIYKMAVLKYFRVVRLTFKIATNPKKLMLSEFGIIIHNVHVILRFQNPSRNQ